MHYLYGNYSRGGCRYGRSRSAGYIRSSGGNTYGNGRYSQPPWMLDYGFQAELLRHMRDERLRLDKEAEARAARVAERRRRRRRRNGDEPTAEEKEREDKEKEEEARRERERAAERERKEKEEEEKREREKREMEERRKREEKEEAERIARREREKNNRPLTVVAIDLKIAENTERHHTDKYKMTKRDPNPELVIRRGEEFNMVITFDRAYSIEKHDVTFTFLLGPADSMGPRSKRRIVMKLHERADYKTENDQFHAKLLSQLENSITVEVFFKADTIIGEWLMYIDTENKTVTGKEYRDTYKHNTEINVICNPWCKHDQVYMGDEDLIKAYVLDGTTKLYRGSSRDYYGSDWQVGAFRDCVLEVAFRLLRLFNGWKYTEHMKDAAWIARALSGAVNQVLVGNWSGDYSGGTQPTAWNNSYDILDQYNKTNKPVKYGQCWVFSGVLLTVLRALGIPSKSVTCFDSAHDTDGSTTIDRLFDENWANKGDDSIWNFHVWNEAWMRRPDLDNGGKYDGWQAVDATPQELSDGRYVCGPAPISAIKKGDINVDYDVPFVFAECNSDVVEYKKDSESGENILLRTRKNETGSVLCSHIPKQSKGSEVVTSHYKFPEHSDENRLAVDRAKRLSPKYKGEVPKAPDILITIKDITVVNIGEDITVEYSLKNEAEGERTLVNQEFVLLSKTYTGRTKAAIILKKLENATLKAGEVKYCKENISSSDYVEKLDTDANMEVSVSGKISHEGITSFTRGSDKFRLKRPELTIKTVEKCKLGDEFEVEMSFKNPLSNSLTMCKLTIDGDECIEGKIKDFKEEHPKFAVWRNTQKVKALEKGSHTLNCVFDCKELGDIYNTVDIFVE